MDKCPICENDYVDLHSHIKKIHPDYYAKAINQMKGEEEDALENVKSRVGTIKARSFGEMRKKLEEQNEIILLQIQQKGLIQALSTGKLPQELQPQNNGLGSIKEAFELINLIRGDFQPQAVEPQSSEDMLLGSALELIKAKMMMGNLPPPPTTPTPQEEEDIPEPPAIEYEINEVEEDDFKHRKKSGSMAPSVSSNIDEPVKRAKEDKQTTIEPNRTNGGSGE